jgi:hypothetical protein
LIDQRFDGRSAIGWVNSAHNANARRRHRADERRLSWREQIDTVERCTHAKAVQERDVSIAVQKDFLKEHHAPYIGNRHRVPYHFGAGASERFEKMLSPVAHLADAAGAPPHVSLCVDQDRGMHRVAVGNPFRHEAVDKTLPRRRETLHLPLPECEEPGRGRELQHLGAVDVLFRCILSDRWSRLSWRGMPTKVIRRRPSSVPGQARPWVRQVTSRLGDPPQEEGRFELVVPL